MEVKLTFQVIADFYTAKRTDDMAVCVLLEHALTLQVYTACSALTPTVQIRLIYRSVTRGDRFFHVFLLISLDSLKIFRIVLWVKKMNMNVSFF